MHRITGDNTLPRHPKECKELGITHVLNAAQGTKFGQVDTNENLYSPYGLLFYGIEAQDNEKFNLASHFYKGKLNTFHIPRYSLTCNGWSFVRPLIR